MTLPPPSLARARGDASCGQPLHLPPHRFEDSQEPDDGRSDAGSVAGSSRGGGGRRRRRPRSRSEVRRERLPDLIWQLLPSR